MTRWEKESIRLAALDANEHLQSPRQAVRLGETFKLSTVPAIRRLGEEIWGLGIGVKGNDHGPTS